MSLVTEDGTGLADAESYISVADAALYHANVGNVAWAALTTSQQEAALRRATNYMVGTYRARWKGLRNTPTQALDWPRIGVILNDTASYFVDQRLAYTVNSNIVPLPVAQACAAMALKASQTMDLDPDLDQKVTSEKIGPLETTYDNMSQQSRRYLSVDKSLNAYLDASNGLSARIIRG